MFSTDKLKREKWCIIEKLAKYLNEFKIKQKS